ncbi:LacI family DNA-binding transcriptional regulator [Actinotalea sp. Marseille-Q4924]|uniref:LacI family DNA-binding transcriptional regulator n=1 Tax=Actinotalea sp. Marseille-Q4924 TaxID=2866571 RepID=UPI001CE490EC|nr:LacI family DNA-binding transcriptional regulator [Actinotalea sp. Marseille-Q4924]
MVSISEVAQQAGVSRTTVSHTLSGKRPVSTETQDRVLESMRALGYVPSRTAQNLALGITRIIALVIPDIGNGYFAELAKGVETTAVERGYNVILCSTGFDPAREVRYMSMIQSRAVDGIVYAAGAPPTESELSAVLGDMPLIFVDEEISGTRFGSVVSDNYAGGRYVAEHLITLGHRSAVVLSVEGDPLTSERRVAGFVETWRAAGYPDPVIGVGYYSEERGRAAVRPHLSALADGTATAVFATNDLIALGVLNELRSAGIRVPDDVSVVGFDDSPAAHYGYPGLTTVRQDVLGLGRTATDALLDALERREPPAAGQVILPVTLVERQTTSRRAD